MRESTAIAFLALSLSFINRRILLRHSVMMIVMTETENKEGIDSVSRKMNPLFSTNFIELAEREKAD